MTPEQKAAYDAVRRATHKGILNKPANCERCGAPDRPASDGRTTLHGHHADYSKPLDLEWLCAACHRKETRLPTGERNGNAKLTAGLVKAATLLSGEGFTLTEIAEFYGISRQGLSHAVTGKNWIAERSK